MPLAHKTTPSNLPQELQNQITNNFKKEEINSRILCVTPKWDYEIDNLFSDFEEDTYCHINAKSVNNKIIDKTTVYIDNITDWNLHFKQFNERFSTIILGNFSIPEYTFDYPVNINISKHTSFDGGISFNTEEKGTIVINAPAEAINELYCPNCDITWTGEAYEYKYAEKNFAFASYNGIERPNWLYFGCKTPEKITINGIEGIIDGNCVYFHIPFLNTFTATSDLLEIVGENIVESDIFDQNGNNYLLITDNEGKKRSYEIIALRQNNNLPVFYIDIEDGSNDVLYDEYINFHKKN